MTISLLGSASFAPMPPWLSRRSASVTALALAGHLGLIWMATRPIVVPLDSDQTVWTPLLLPRVAPPVYLLPPAPGRVDRQAHASQPPAPALPRPAGPSGRAASAAATPPERTPASVPETGSNSGAGTAAGTNSNANASASRTAQVAGKPDNPPQDEFSLPAATSSQPAATPDAGRTVPADLLAQALKSAGAIDRQLRAEHPKHFTAPADTPHTRLAKGMAEAHAAVKPGLFEAPKIELFSLPNDPKRIYKVVTGLGEYCVFYPDKGGMAENLAARAGHADFGQPRMGTCPTRF